MSNNDNVTIVLEHGTDWCWSELMTGWGNCNGDQATTLALLVTRRFNDLTREHGWEVVWTPHTADVYGRKELERIIPDGALDALREQATAEVFAALVYNDIPTDPAWIGEMVNKIFS